MPIRNGDYETRSEDTVFDHLVTELKDEEADTNPRAEATYTYALLFAVASTVAQNQEQSLKHVYRSAYVQDATKEELTKKARNLGVVRKDARKATGVVTFSRDNPATTDYTIPSGTVVETLAADPVQFETTHPTVIDGPDDVVDGSTYTTTSTGYVTKTSHTVEVAFRDSVDVQADLKISNSSGTASVQVVDATNDAIITTFSTANTSYTTGGPTSYDVSGLSEDVTVEYRVKSSSSSYTASLTNTEVDLPGQTGAKATVKALNGGSQGNVGPNAIQSMPSPITGINSVTNTQATGDPSLSDTDGDPLVSGRDRETDAELRQRVLDTDASDEGPSSSGLELALEDVEGVVSKHVNTNQTDSTVDGLDPYHTEVVVYGGDTYDIATTLHETMSMTAFLRLQGGVNGTKETTTVHDNLLEQDITTPITRPTKVTFDLELDVVHTGNYAGDVAVKNAIIDYTGGVYPDDSTGTGLGLGDDVLINEVENRVEDVQGVEYADVTLVDRDGDGTDDTTTDGDGVPVLSIADSSVTHPDADAFTLSKTAR